MGIVRSTPTYGEDGVACGRDRTLRLMKELGLEARLEIPGERHGSL